MRSSSVVAFGIGLVCLCLAVAGCASTESPRASSSSSSGTASDQVADRSLEACVGKAGAPAKAPAFEDIEPILKDAGMRLSDALAPLGDDYWLAVDFPDERRAEEAATPMATVAARGMFGPLELRRSGVSVAIVPPAGGPLEDVYRDMPDIKRLRSCTKSYEVVPPSRE